MSRKVTGQRDHELGRLWLVRHGETEWSRSGRHTGRSDIPLTDVGRRQATALRRHLSAPVLILTSPRQRATETVKLAGLTETDTPVRVTDDLAEWDYGEYEGLTTPEIRVDRPGWTIWSGGVPGGETAAEVTARADRVLDAVREALPGGDVLLVGHGHLFRVLTARWLGLAPEAGALFVLYPASPCLLGSEHGEPAVVRWNVPVDIAVPPGM